MQLVQGPGANPEIWQGFFILSLKDSSPHLAVLFQNQWPSFTLGLGVSSSIRMLLLHWVIMCSRVLVIYLYIEMVEFPHRPDLPYQRVSCSSDTFSIYFLSLCMSLSIMFRISLINLILSVVRKWTLCHNLELWWALEVVYVFFLYHFILTYFSILC